MVDAAKACAGRIDRVRAMMYDRGYDAVVVRDEANLRWLTGAMGVFDYTYEFPHVAFITRDACFLHTDSRYLNSFEENLPEGHSWKLDMDDVAMPRWVADRALETSSRVVAVEDDMQISFFKGIERALEDVSIRAALPLMHEDIQHMRAVKDEQELQLMEHAQSITDAAFEHMCEWIRPGLTEKEIRTELENFMFSHGADSLAFGSIVASGPNTANPHAVPSDRVVEKGDFILMDYGAGYRDYRSDMTRTVCLGEASHDQRLLYDTVRRAHEECAAAIRAGIDGHEIHLLAKKIIGEAGYGDYFNHGLGHGVGIDIHELPCLNSRSHMLTVGSVVTVEPGIYLPGVGGVRLEDYGVVTEEGFRPFTKSSHDLVEIPC
ncbi:MAG: Xaa-Pro peptidase family protein [Coriobacteriaceae bacterium]|nr:Xaa-Pro peptidase family protein [Coriobacteriaceae bacterium]